MWLETNFRMTPRTITNITSHSNNHDQSTQKRQMGPNIMHAFYVLESWVVQSRLWLGDHTRGSPIESHQTLMLPASSIGSLLYLVCATHAQLWQNNKTLLCYTRSNWLNLGCFVSSAGFRFPPNFGPFWLYYSVFLKLGISDGLCKTPSFVHLLLRDQTFYVNNDYHW